MSKKILFISASRVGDAILSTGLLDRLVSDNPGASVTVACGPAAAPLFEAVPGLERIIVLDKMVMSLHWPVLWSACVGRVWDILVDLRRSPMLYLLVAHRKIGLKPNHRQEHRVRHLARVLGLGDNPPPPKLWMSSDHRERAERLIPDGLPVLAVGPTANWRAKTWRAVRFSELIEKLSGPKGILPSARVAVFGRDDERPQATGLIETIPDERRIDLVGRVDLLDAYACLSRCALYIGNDSGLMHLAAAAGIPTLGLFGPSREELYAPWGDNCATVRTKASFDDIFPANFDHLSSDTLMDGLGVDVAVRAAEELWDRAG